MGPPDRDETDDRLHMTLDLDEVEPPAGLRERLLADVRGERQVSRPKARRTAWALASLGMLAWLGVLAWGLSLDRSLEHSRSLRRNAVDALVLVSRADTRTLRLQRADGLPVLEHGGRAVLVVAGLVGTPPGKTYQAWLIRSGPAAPAGAFSGGDALSVVPLTQRVPRGGLVAVSLERSDGARRPHAPVVFAAARSF